MGLFDRIVRNVVRDAERTLVNAVSDSVSTAVNNKIRDAVDDKVKPVVNKSVDKMSAAAEAVREHGAAAYFETKLKEILDAAGEYEIRRNIEPSVIENEYGQDIYYHHYNKCYCKPENITFGIYKNGERVVYIRFWKEYGTYNRTTNREIKRFCQEWDVPMLDFFEYLPNEKSYIEKRISRYL